MTQAGEDLLGAFTSPFRYHVPLIPPFDDIDDNLLTNAAASMIASLNAAGATDSSGSCGHGHSHHHSHHHHHHNPLHSHHNSRQIGHSGENAISPASGLHHRSVSASAVSSSSSNSIKTYPNANSSNGSASAAANNTLLIGSNAMGFIPIGNVANELAANFAGCDDPNHNHHHHHHHAFHHDNNGNQNGGSPTPGSSTVATNAQSTANLLAASANQLFANNPILLQAATAAISHHQHILDNQRHHQHQQGSLLKRFVTRLSSVYTNRKRFSDQEKAVIFMLSFLFFTFLFATLVKMFMR